MGKKSRRQKWADEDPAEEARIKSLSSTPPHDVEVRAEEKEEDEDQVSVEEEAPLPSKQKKSRQQDEDDEIAPFAPQTLSGLDGLLLQLRTKSRSGGVFGIFFYFLYWVLSLFSSTKALDQVSLITEELEEQQEEEKRERAAEREREIVKQAQELQFTHLYDESSGMWRQMNECEKDAFGSVVPSLRYHDGHWERWQKNLKTKSKHSTEDAYRAGGQWMRVRANEAWISAPQKLKVENDTLAGSDLEAFLCFNRGGEDVVIECSEWAFAQFAPRDTFRSIGVIDASKSVMKASVGSHGMTLSVSKGVAVPSDNKKLEEETDANTNKKGKRKTKVSRAEKRERNSRR